METHLEDSKGIQKMVSGGLSVMAIENENQRQIALQKPRVMADVYRDVLQELDLVPEFAAKAFYSIPYKNDVGSVTYVEGPSIKAAMSLARRWGNCSNAGRVVEDRDDRIIVEGAFVDYETGFRTLRQVSVARGAWNKMQKRVVPLREDRLNLSIQSGISKAVRNAILASLPVSLVEAYMRKAKEAAAAMIGEKKMPKKILSVADRIKNAKDMFIKLGVTADQWTMYMEKMSVQDDELLAHLVGLYSAINEGQARIEDVFGELAVAPKPETGEVKRDELFKK